MRRSNLLVVLLWITLSLAAAAHAQPIVTQADVLAQLTASARITNYRVLTSGAALAQMQALADLSGAGQTWDFSALTFNPSLSYEVGPATLPVPGASGAPFVGATHAQQYTQRTTRGDSTWYSLHRITPAAFEIVGLSGTTRRNGVDTTFGFSYTPTRLVYPLPLTSQSTWTTRWAFDTGTPTPGVTTEVEEQAQVQGWGTLVLPSGTADVLSVRTKYVTTSTVVSGGQSFVIRDSSYTVTFFSASAAGALVFLDRTGKVTDMQYTAVFTRTDAESSDAWMGLSLGVDGPQPARVGTPVPVRFTLPTPDAVRLDVFDLHGRRMATLTHRAFGAGEHVTPWSPAGLAAGVYLLRLTTSTQTRTHPLVLVR